MEGFEVLPTILSIVVVLAVLGATLFMLRWATGTRGSGSGRRKTGQLIDVVERQSVGRNCSLVVIRYNNTERLLGVTETSITALGEGVIDLRETASDEAPQRPRVRASSALESLRAKTVRH